MVRVRLTEDMHVRLNAYADLKGVNFQSIIFALIEALLRKNRPTG